MVQSREKSRQSKNLWFRNWGSNLIGFLCTRKNKELPKDCRLSLLNTLILTKRILSTTTCMCTLNSHHLMNRGKRKSGRSSKTCWNSKTALGLSMFTLWISMDSSLCIKMYTVNLETCLKLCRILWRLKSLITPQTLHSECMTSGAATVSSYFLID